MSELPALSVMAFMELFTGRTDAYGTGNGEWIRRPVTPDLYRDHLGGKGPGLGIGPMRDDHTVSFAAIDLDEPDFEAARLMQKFLPGKTWIERSRSGNAHVWAFFLEPIAGWVPRGLMRMAAEAAGKPRTEVFPKQDRLREGSLGNYINLPYHGGDRPVLDFESERGFIENGRPYDLATFLRGAHRLRIDPVDWQTRAEWMQLSSPEEKALDRGDETPFGEQPMLHICARHQLEHRFDNPVKEGGRHVVMFNFAKQLLNWKEVTDTEAYELLELINETAEPPLSEYELRRQFDNALNGQWKSTGCDEPEMAPYVHPDCPIAHGRR